ncbi:MAG TPA: DUF4397 domain-containing protein [Gemmatimonas sp.]|nr:DUF4397 domain-containing protein [Gemmatimonas sp.]
MRVQYSALLAALCLSTVLVACADDPTPAQCCTTGTPSLRIVNAFSGPVDVLIDGSIAIAALSAGTIDTVATPVGTHTLALRPAGNSATAMFQSIATTTSLSTIAVVRAANGSIATAALDDTNSVVPAGATKVRVLHFAPNAGTLQVYRTQPDFAQPVSWQFPFEYQAQPTSLTAPFYQSTVGTWEVRVWQTPADATGWGNAPVKITIPLASGGKRTVLLLDKPGGGVRFELL